MRMQKGQVSLFLIIGVTIALVAILVIFLVMKSVPSEADTVSFSKSSLNSYITDSLYSATDDGLHTIAIQGGYLDIPSSLHYNASNHSSTSLMQEQEDCPSVQEVEEALERYIDNHLKEYLNNFRAFNRRGIEVEYSAPRSEVTLFDEKALVELTMPTTIKKDEARITMETFHFEKRNVRMPLILELVNKIISFTYEDRAIDMTTLHNYPFSSTIIKQGDELVYSIRDDITRLGSKPLRFRFATNFTHLPQ